MLSILACGRVMCALASETAGVSPYQAVVERNVFGLKSLPPPPGPNDNKPPPPKIYLQGITTILGNKRALLKTAMSPKPGEQSKGEQSFVLAEGQREGEIEVLEIDDKAGTVKVKNFGTIVDLDFDKDGIKTASSPIPGVPGKPGGPGQAPPPGPFVPGGGPNPIPTARPMRLPTPTAGMAAPAGYGGTITPTAYNSGSTAANYASTEAVTSSGSSAGTVTLPSLGTTASTVSQQRNWPPEVSLTAEQAAIVEAAYMMKNKAAIEQGTMPSIPGANPLLDSGTTQTQTVAPKTPNPTLPLPPGSARPVVLPQ
jgi:hypothetical protein